MNYGTLPKEDHMIGGKDRPYVLHWPATQYQREGKKLGFTFSREDMERAENSGGVLGVRRYLPRGEARIKLAIPPGSFVKCCLL